MIKLEKEFEATPDRVCGSRIFTQIQRNERVAIYQRTVKASGKPEGYEVFIIRTDPKGVIPFPNGRTQIVADEIEKYPNYPAFGRTAWAVMTLERAKEKFDELTATIEKNANPSVKPPIIIPDNEWTVKDLAKLNNIPVYQASNWIKRNNAIIKFVRAERRHKMGKPTNIYTKI